MVVVQPKTSVAPVPRKGEITWADEFAGFTHERILPWSTDKFGIKAPRSK